MIYDLVWVLGVSLNLGFGIWDFDIWNLALLL